MKPFCENSYFRKNAPSWMFNLLLNTGPSNTKKKELYLEHLFLELLCYIFCFQFCKVLVLEKKLVPKFALESLLNKVSGLRSVKKETTGLVFSWKFCGKLETLITFFVALQNVAKKIEYRSFFRDSLYTSFPLLSEPW